LAGRRRFAAEAWAPTERRPPIFQRAGAAAPIEIKGRDASPQASHFCGVAAAIVSRGAGEFAAVVDELADFEGEAGEVLDELVDRGGLDAEDGGGFFHGAGEGAGFAGEEDHLAEEVSFGKVRDGIFRGGGGQGDLACEQDEKRFVGGSGADDALAGAEELEPRGVLSSLFGECGGVQRRQ